MLTTIFLSRWAPCQHRLWPRCTDLVMQCHPRQWGQMYELGVDSMGSGLGIPGGGRTWSLPGKKNRGKYWYSIFHFFSTYLHYSGTWCCLEHKLTSHTYLRQHSCPHCLCDKDNSNSAPIGQWGLTCIGHPHC